MAAIDQAIKQLDAILGPLLEAQRAQPGTAPAPAPQAALSDDDLKLFQTSKIGVGRITAVEDHPAGSDKLWVMKVDVGGGEEKDVCAGLRKHFPAKSDLQDRLVVVVLNLKAAKLGGVKSEVMILAADTADPSAPDGRVVKALEPPAGSEPGDLVTLEGVPLPDTFNATCKKWSAIAKELSARGGAACYRGAAFVTARGRVTVPPEIAEGGSIQ